MRFMPRSASGRRKVAQYAFLAIGILALGYCLVVFLEARFYQAREARNFARKLALKQAERKTQPPGPRAPIPHTVLAPPRDGAVVGRLAIPRLGVSVMVVQGVGNSDLRRAVGHIPGTALPGEMGNVGIAGHRDTFFRPLREIQRNDTIELTTLAGTDRFRVVSTEVVPPRDIQVLYPTADDILTLVTCFPFNYIGAAPKRFIVRAERIPAT